MDTIIQRVKSIIMDPKGALNAVKSEEMELMPTMKSYVIYLAAIPPVAQFIGRALVGHPLIGRQRFFPTLFFAALSYGLSLVAVIVFTKIINALAPNFNSVKNEINAFKVVIYAWTPGYVAGVFYLIPNLEILALFGSLYGLYILYLGLPVLMETPQDKALGYTIVTIIVGIIVMLVVGAIASAIAFGAGGSTFYL